MADYEQAFQDEIAIGGSARKLGVDMPIVSAWTGAGGAEPIYSEYSLHFKTASVLRWEVL
jgi:hypothetical protein